MVRNFFDFCYLYKSPLSKINIGVLFPTWGFEDPLAPRIPKWEKLDY